MKKPKTALDDHTDLMLVSDTLRKLGIVVPFPVSHESKLQRAKAKAISALREYMELSTLR